MVLFIFGYNARLDDVIRNFLVKIAEDLCQRPRDARVGTGDRLVQRNDVVRARDGGPFLLAAVAVDGFSVGGGGAAGEAEAAGEGMLDCGGGRAVPREGTGREVLERDGHCGSGGRRRLRRSSELVGWSCSCSCSWVGGRRRKRGLAQVGR